MVRRIVLGLAGVAGAAGVALGAVAAHLAGGAEITTASNFLLFHAAAAVALVALVPAGARAGLPLAAAAVMLTGVALFAGDLALRQLAGTKLLWGTAPVGGTLMIAGWLAVAIVALVARDIG